MSLELSFEYISLHNIQIFSETLYFSYFVRYEKALVIFTFSWEAKSPTLFFASVSVVYDDTLLPCHTLIVKVYSGSDV